MRARSAGNQASRVRALTCPRGPVWPAPLLPMRIRPAPPVGMAEAVGTSGTTLLENREAMEKCCGDGVDVGQDRRKEDQVHGVWAGVG